MLGYQAGKFVSTGTENTFIGMKAGLGITGTRLTGAYNVAVGGSVGIALQGGAHSNTFVGYYAGNTTTTGTGNTIIGYNCEAEDATAVNQTVIGNGANGQADNSVTLGNADVTAVYMAQDSGAKVHCSAIIHTQENVTIASDAITVTSSYVRVLTQDSATSDELATISGGSAGQVLYLHQQLSTKDVTLKDGTGNLALAGDFAMSHSQDMIQLIYSAADSVWLEVSRSNNA